MDVQTNGEHDSASVNRQIKDGVFRLLFDNQENAAELYYALSGNKCSPNEIQIITLTTVVSGKLKNDLAFVVNGKAMIVGEHMSSPYVNMPIRLLMYTGQLYEKWIKMKGDEKFLYQSKPYKIPTPEFAVFYNGAEQRPEKELLCLSSAFENIEGSRFGRLELEVPVYNINKGMNAELFQKSDKLRQYAEFVEKLRRANNIYDDYAKGVEAVVKDCIDNNILSDFLKEHGGEVVSILTMEYNTETAKRVYAEEQVEEIAQKMLAKGIDLLDVIDITGLSMERMRELHDTLRSEAI